jgi:DNA (cytosine-5)-methyltransferase 1
LLRTGADLGPGCEALVAHSLRAEGFDASEDGTGRGTPIVPVCRDVAPALTSNYGKQVDSSDTSAGPMVLPVQQPYSIMPMNSGKDYKARETDVAQPIMAGGPVGGNQGGDVVATQEPFTIMERGRNGGSNLESRQDGTANAILTPNGGRGGLGVGAIAAAWGVRRLTPTECERLQGFPDGWTAIPWGKKLAEDCPDGPRYKALGNSMAVNCMIWLGERLDMLSKIEASADVL